MDLEAGSVAGRDGLRLFMRAGNSVSSDELQAAWDAMCDHAPEEVREEFLTDAPAAVLEWAYTCAAAIWRNRDQGGGSSTTADDTFGPGQVATGVIMRRNRALLPPRMGATHRTIAGAS